MERAISELISSHGSTAVGFKHATQCNGMGHGVGHRNFDTILYQRIVLRQIPVSEIETMHEFVR